MYSGIAGDRLLQPLCYRYLPSLPLPNRLRSSPSCDLVAPFEGLCRRLGCSTNSVDQLDFDALIGG
jgi:hypothetical protein